MTTFRRIRRTPLLMGLSCMVLSACSGVFGSETPETRYYVLSATQATAAAGTNAKTGPGVGISLIAMPDYLNHPGITTRKASNEIVRAEYDQWAGPLADEVLRVAAENISLMLPSGRVTTASGRRAVPIDFVVELEISEFLQDESGAISLVARWNVFREAERTVVAVQTSRIRRPIASADHSGAVAAMSAAIEELCREIVRAIAGAQTAAAMPSAFYASAPGARNAMAGRGARPLRPGAA